jgi:hypothetical protein
VTQNVSGQHHVESLAAAAQALGLAVSEVEGLCVDLVDAGMIERGCSDGTLATLAIGRCSVWTMEDQARRLTGSRPEASPTGSLQPTLGSLPAERAIRRVTTFQMTRSARLALALRMIDHEPARTART